jgi:hypothetical protein
MNIFDNIVDQIGLSCGKLLILLFSGYFLFSNSI